MDILLDEAHKINSAHGLSEKELERACALSQKYNKPLSIAFEYLDDMRLQLESGYLDYSVQSWEVEFLCFKLNLSVSEGIAESKRLHNIGVKSILKLTDDFLKIYLSRANELYRFDAETIKAIAKDLKNAKIPAEEFDDVFDFADFFGGDLDEAIANYKNSDFWNGLQDEYDGLD